MSTTEANAVPEALCGVWRRTMSLSSDGVAEARPRVVRLQAAHHFAELAVPSGRPPAPGRAALEACSPAELAALADRAGAAGRAWIDGARICRSPDLAWRPEDLRRSEALHARTGDHLVERAPEDGRREDWRLEPGSAGTRAAYALEERAEGGDAVRHGRLVLVGEHLVLARDRLVALDPSRTLADLAADAGEDRARLDPLFDAETSHARRHGAGGLWLIDASTLPYREGTLLAGDIAAAAARGEADLVETMRVDGQFVERRWRRLEHRWA